MSLNLDMARDEMLLLPILESLPEGLIITDRDLKITFINSTAEKIFQATLSQVAGRHYSVLSPSLELERIVNRGEKRTSTTLRIGKQEYIANLGAISSNSHIFGAYAILQLLETLPQQQLETILENPYEGILILDKESNITYANQACYEFFKCDRIEDLKHHLEPFFPNSCLTKAFITKKPVSGDSLVIRNHKIDITYLPISEEERVLGVIVKCKIAPPSKDWNHYIEKLTTGTAKYTMDDIVGNDAELLAQKEMARRASRTTSTILITGESGTGKEIFAHAIHNASPRKNQPFVRVNCAAVPETLLESELFGYSEGAFTGARKGGKPGKFELANRGTIFLDEIADMSLAMQAKLLRVLQEREVERVGSTKTTRVDVRVIAATNQNLERLVAQGKFREDLYYRLNVIVIELPPLRSRLGDIELLVQKLLQRLNLQLGTKVREVSPEVLDLFRRYPWPGNIRELENVLERAANFCEDGVIRLENLPESLRRFESKNNSAPLNRGGLETTIMETEKEIIIQALLEAQGNKSLAAQKLNIHRSVLYRKLQKYNIGL